MTVGVANGRSTRTTRRGADVAFRVAVRNDTARRLGSSAVRAAVPRGLGAAARTVRATVPALAAGRRGTAVLRVRTGRTARRGTYRLLVRVRIGGAEHRIPVALRVR